MRPVRTISDAEEGFHLVRRGPFHVPRRNPVQPEPVGTIVLAAFRITGYHRDCDGSLMASLQHIVQDGETTGWESDGHGLYPDSYLVVSPEEWKAMFATSKLSKNIWTSPHGAEFDLDDPAQCAAAYYLVASLQHTQRPRPKPPVVPSRIRVRTPVHGDFLTGREVTLDAGEYDCLANRYGAVSVLVNAQASVKLGLKLDEFEPLAWRDNRDPKETET